jgi:hypothetical protein
MTDQPDTPFNPYQSPAWESDEAQAGPSPENVFGLQRPIHAEGTLAAEDFRQLYKPTRGDRIWAIFYLSFPVTLLVYVLWPSERPIWSPGAPLAFALLWLGLTGLVVLFPLGRWRSREAAKRATLERTTFFEDRIEVESRRGRAVWRWSAFYQCSCSEHVVSLHLGRPWNAILYPRRFFADEADWRTFVALVRCKLPEGERMARRQSAGPGAPMPVPPLCRLEAPGGDRPGAPEPLIAVSGRASPKEWEHVQRLLARPGSRWTGRLGCFALLVLGSLASAWWAASSDGARVPGIVFCVLASCMALAVLGAPGRALRRQWKRGEGPFEPFTVRAWDDGVEFATAHSTVKFRWDAFARFTQSERAILLHHHQRGALRYVLRSAFRSDEQWEAFAGLVRQKLPEQTVPPR